MTTCAEKANDRPGRTAVDEQTSPGDGGYPREMAPAGRIVRTGPAAGREAAVRETAGREADVREAVGREEEASDRPGRTAVDEQTSPGDSGHLKEMAPAGRIVRTGSAADREVVVREVVGREAAGREEASERPGRTAVDEQTSPGDSGHPREMAPTGRIVRTDRRLAGRRLSGDGWLGSGWSERGGCRRVGAVLVGSGERVAERGAAGR
ncbi:hypothetical protein [Actinocorallia libanotica]|uniref:DUF2382 domain-containing protein n=1 Tax=Actinocorallia libanotica TaxID=46162 RepID=A0ABN1RRE0_9ACTN